MFDRIQEEQHLAEANQHIADAELRIEQCMDRLDMVRAKRLNTEQDEKLLLLLLQTMDTMQRHRAVILERLKDAL